MAPTPLNPDYELRVRESFSRQGFMNLIGASVTEVKSGRCVLHLPHRADIDQHKGYAHGGAVASVADTAVGYAAFSLAPTDASILTVEFKINFLSGAAGELIIAEGEVIRAGRSLTVCQGRVYDQTGSRRSLRAIMIGTLMILPGRADSPHAKRPTTKRQSRYIPSTTRGGVQPAAHNYADHVNTVFARQPFSALLGLRLESIAPGYSVCSLQHNADLSQQHGFFHGGVIATIADLAMGAAAGSLVDVGVVPLTAEFKLNLMAPGDGHSLRAYGHVIRPGRTVSICRADVTTIDSEGNEFLCVSAMGTLVPIAG